MSNTSDRSRIIDELNKLDLEYIDLVLKNADIELEIKEHEVAQQRSILLAGTPSERFAEEAPASNQKRPYLMTEHVTNGLRMDRIRVEYERRLAVYLGHAPQQMTSVRQPRVFSLDLGDELKVKLQELSEHHLVKKDGQPGPDRGPTDLCICSGCLGCTSCISCEGCSGVCSNGCDGIKAMVNNKRDVKEYE